MTTLDQVLEAAVVACVRRHVSEVQQRPIFVSQRNCEAILGIPRRDFLRLCREGAWPSSHEKRIVLAKTEHVAAYIERRMATAEREAPAPTPEASEARALARVGARRVA